VFPGVLWAGRLHHAGAVIFSLAFQQPPLVLEDFDPVHLRAQLRARRPNSAPEPGTVLLLIDGLSEGISGLLAALYGHYGHHPAYLGAGAGTRAITPGPCLLSSQGVLDQAAVIALLPTRVGVGVCHGWQPVGDPVLCTQAHDLWVDALNWQPAYEVYADIVCGHAGRKPLREAFFETAKAYPFGIYREGQEPVVRDPIAVQGESIRCVGEVPENALLQILHGKSEQLRDAAANAAHQSLTRADGPFLVVDCVSRAVFQGEDFARELTAVDQVLSVADVPLWAGVLSLGEVVLDASGLLELYNKTIVVGGLRG